MLENTPTPEAPSGRELPASLLAVLIMAGIVGLLCLPVLAPRLGLLLTGPATVILLFLLLRSTIREFRLEPSSLNPLIMIPVFLGVGGVFATCLALVGQG